MKLNYLICILVVMFLCTGCSTMSSRCQPLADIDTLVITPVKVDKTYVEEEKYRGLPPAIAASTAFQLKELVEDSKMFSNVILSSECVDRAIIIDAMIYSLIHKKGNFNVKAIGKISNCKTGMILDKFENNNHDSESVKLPRKIAEEIADGINSTLCVKK